MPLGFIAVLLWLTVTSVLSGALVEPLSFALAMSLCFLLGYSLLSLWRSSLGALDAVLASILGVALLTTIYALTRFYGSHQFHYVFLAVGVATGTCRLALVARVRSKLPHQSADAILKRDALLAAIVVMLVVGSAFYFSGRVSHGELSFFGPMSRDHAFHLGMVERLHAVVPYDNFVVTGYQPPVYHFFSDLAVNLLARDMGPDSSVLNVYFRLYPGALFFALGFLAYYVPARLFASRTAGAIGVALLLFGGDLSWALGLLQTINHLPDWASVQQNFFSDWVHWNAFGTLYPLVHRPAYYHGLLLFLAGLAPIAERGPRQVRAWALAGLFWGLMAGFNYTFAATVGVAVAGVCLVFLVRGDRENFRLLALCGMVMVFASVIANIFVLIQKVGSDHAASPIRWSPGEFAQMRYGWIFGDRHGLVPLLGSVFIMAVLCYGVKLVGLWPMYKRTGLGVGCNGPLGAVLLVALMISLALGMLFSSSGQMGSGNAIMFLQPTAWIMALFAIFTLTRWVEHQRSWLRPVILAVLLLVGPLHAFSTFNLGYRVRFDPAYLAALESLRDEAAATDVVAYWPGRIQSQSVFGPAPAANNFFVAAFTGLRGYVAVPGYSHFAASAGPSGGDIYRGRAELVEQFQDGKIDTDEIRRLFDDGVRWIVLEKAIEIAPKNGLKVWRSSPAFTILRIERMA